MIATGSDGLFPMTVRSNCCLRNVYHSGLIIDRYENIHMVIGIPPLPGYLIAFLKYFPCKSKSHWKNLGGYYCRSFNEYTQYSIISHSKIVNDPRYMTSVPVIDCLSVKKIYDPIDRLRDIIYHPKDELESLVVDAIEFLTEMTDVNMNNIGIVGSLLLGMHNPKRSDIDFIIIGEEDSLKVYSFVKESNFNHVVNWSSLNTKYLLDTKNKRVLNNTRTRVVIKNKIVSFTFVNGSLDREKSCRNGRDVFSLNDINIIKYNNFSGKIRLEQLGSLLTYPPCFAGDISIISFDQLLAPIFYENDCIYVENVLLGINHDGRKILFFGVKESPLVKITSC